jgi:hypothetical protein
MAWSKIQFFTRHREAANSAVLDGHATATPGIMYAGGRPITVTWLTITDIGRQALAG